MRALETAHYISDVLFASYLEVLLAAWTARVFARSGIDLAEAKADIFRAKSDMP